MKILGIHDGQNASAALVVDGRVVRFGLEARYRRAGEFAGFPRRAIRRILAEEKISPSDIDAVAFAGHVMKTPRTSRDYLKQFSDNSALGDVAKTALSYIVPGAFRTELRKKDRLEALAQNGFDAKRATFVDSHLAASMLAYNSGAGVGRRSLILCAGTGNDRMAATVHVAQHGRLERIATVHEDDSLMNMCEHVTYLLGMAPQRDEQLVMDLGARAHGPRVESAKKRFELLFEFDEMLPLNWQRASNLPDTARCQDFLRNHFRRRRFDSIAGGWHIFLCQFVREWIRRCAHKTEIRDIILCGDLFELGELLAAASTLREIVSISRSPLPGSAGNAIGAAMLISAEREDNGIEALTPLTSSYFGRRHSRASVDSAVASYQPNAGVRVEALEKPEERVADLLASGAVLARMAGPEDLRLRGLGNRSVIARSDSAPARFKVREIAAPDTFWAARALLFQAESLRSAFIEATTLPEAAHGEYYLTPRNASPWYGLQEGLRVPVQAIARSANPVLWRTIEHYHQQAGRTPLITALWRDDDGQVVRTPQQALALWEAQGLSGLVLGNWLIYREDLEITPSTERATARQQSANEKQIP